MHDSSGVHGRHLPGMPDGHAGSHGPSLRPLRPWGLPCRHSHDSHWHLLYALPGSGGPLPEQAEQAQIQATETPGGQTEGESPWPC